MSRCPVEVWFYVFPKLTTFQKANKNSESLGRRHFCWSGIKKPQTRDSRTLANDGKRLLPLYRARRKSSLLFQRSLPYQHLEELSLPTITIIPPVAAAVSLSPGHFLIDSKFITSCFSSVWRYFLILDQLKAWIGLADETLIRSSRPPERMQQDRADASSQTSNRWLQLSE